MALVNESAPILRNEELGPRLFLMELEARTLARTLVPGQFVHLRLPALEAHILRRPFSVYSWDAQAGTIEIFYQVVGEGTSHMSGLEPGEVCELIGPVGQGWTGVDASQRALIVAGGVGAAPVYMLTRELREKGVKLEVVLGAQSRDTLVSYERYLSLLGEDHLYCATDDGSFGREGFCTLISEELLQTAENDKPAFDYVACCGPEPLMKIVAAQAKEAGVVCEVSLERRMACGVGACLSCVVDTTEGKKRACVDGPVFDAQKVVW